MLVTLRDAYDEIVTSNSAKAVESYVEGVQCIMMRNSGADEALDLSIQEDPDLAVAHIAKAIVLQQASQNEGALAEARRAQELATYATRREQAHVHALATAVEGKTATALDLIEEQLKEFPRDAFLLNRNQFLLNNSGRVTRKEEGLAAMNLCARSYGEDAWFLSSYAMAQNEMYHFVEARALVEKSFALNPRNASCAHSTAHVMFETGEHGSGASFLEGWLDGSPWQEELAGHLTWHLALFELGRGNDDAAATLLEERLRPSKYPGIPGRQIGLSDSASLLWRCELFSIEAPQGLDKEVAQEAKRFARAGVAFADVHKALAYAYNRDGEAIANLAMQTQALVDQGKLAAGPVVPAIINAVWAFAEGRYEEAARTMEPYVAEFVRIGGSRAQYEVIQDTLIAAYVRAGQMEKAAPILRERLDRRPSARDEALLLQAQAQPAV